MTNNMHNINMPTIIFCLIYFDEIRARGTQPFRHFFHQPPVAQIIYPTCKGCTKWAKFIRRSERRVGSRAFRKDPHVMQPFFDFEIHCRILAPNTYVSVWSFTGAAMIPGSATRDFATVLFINSWKSLLISCPNQSRSVSVRAEMKYL